MAAEKVEEAKSMAAEKVESVTGSLTDAVKDKVSETVETPAAQ